MRKKTIITAKQAETRPMASVFSAHKPKPAQAMNWPVDRILHLQHIVGNQAVQRMIQSGTIQTKLKIGRPNDKYEQEADRMADQVMRMPEPHGQRQTKPEEEEEEKVQTKALSSQITPLVQRQVTDEEKEEPLQTKIASIQTPEVAPNIRASITALRGRGQPLPASTRAFFEPRFGYDFSQVRVHTDAQAADSARAVNARAFTTGKDVVFGAGQYAPGTTSGQRLLAHELTHVVQQKKDFPLQRATLRDRTGNPVSFEFRIGTELSLPFASLAQKLSRGGSVSDNELRSLRNHALRVRGTVGDYERMFMAGLISPANVATLQTTPLRQGASITFPLTTISTARVQHVINLERQHFPAHITDLLNKGLAAFLSLEVLQAVRLLGEAETIALNEIVVHAGSFKAQSARLISFARSHNIRFTEVLQTMLAAASDSTAGDKVMAGTVYAAARQVNHPLTSDLLNGNIKVDALISRAFARLPGLSGNVIAAYVPVALEDVGGLKGDTLYVQTTLDIGNLGDRSAIIHELQHVRDDKAASPTAQQPQTNRIELNAYRAQARYILDQMVAQTPDEQSRSVGQLRSVLHGILYGALVLEGQRSPVNYQTVLEFIFRAANPPFRQNAAGVARLMSSSPAKIETAVLQDIDTMYKLASGDHTVLDGLAGESLIHWINRI